jgi:hypothetical protein
MREEAGTVRLLEDPATSQGVTPLQALDQPEPAEGGADDDASLQAVTEEAVAKVTYWTGGGWSPRALQRLQEATMVAVGVFGLKLRLSGTRVSFVSAEGVTYSVAHVLRAARRVRVKHTARCDACGEPIPLDAYRRQQRGARQDRHYCSNACRQRAYRQRKGTP